MQLIDLPYHVPIERYAEVTDSMGDHLIRLPGVVAVYQVGGVSTPGISDLDLLAIFDDGAKCREDPRHRLSPEDNYLFVHQILGTCASNFMASFRHGSFHNFRLLRGHDLLPSAGGPAQPNADAIARQIALEYLVKLYVSQVLERTLGILKVRGLLLHARSLHYDLENVGEPEGAIRHLLATVLRWRTEWFERRPDRESLVDWFESFHEELRRLLQSQLRATPLYVPRHASLQIAPNITLARSETLRYAYGGISLPGFFRRFGRRYASLQGRLRRYEIGLPITDRDNDGLLADRHAFISRAVAYNELHLPCFLPGPYVLQIFGDRNRA